MEEIIEIVKNLVDNLETSKRVKNVFSSIDKDDRNNNFTSSDYLLYFKEDFYKTLSLLIELESIELIDRNSIDDKEVIINNARALFNKLSIFERNNNDEFRKLFNPSYNENLWLFVYLKCLVLIYVCSSSFEYDYSEESIRLASEYFVSGNVFYRGHSNIEYKIVPSMVRSLNRTKRIDYSYICKLYKKSNLLDKYQLLIDPSANVDYSFCSFVQHATSYSPFIDFTTEKDIALSFATYPNGNLNTYNGTDASLIVLAAKEIDKNDINVSKIDLDYHAKKLNFKSLIYGKPLYLCDIGDFDVKFGISNNSTNDRMKYQKGIFFCFYRCVIVKGVPLMPWSKGYLLTFRIKAKNNAKKGELTKQDIYNSVINSKPYYDYQNLMEPYDFFTEYNK